MNRYRVQRLTGLVQTLDAVREGTLYGSNMGNSNQHSHYDVPRVLVGGAGGRLQGDRQLAYESRTVPMGNLLLSNI